jgi:hypothetical protein
MKRINNLKNQNNYMNKTILFLLTSLIVLTPSFAIFGLFEKPITTLDMVQLHTIFNDLNATGQTYSTTCAPLHFQVPYKQTHEITYVKVGYLPICDVNQSDYPDHAITLYCESEYVGSWNYTENCERNISHYDSEWIVFDYENSSAVFFQSDVATSVFSCSFCVNDSLSIPNRTDFWIRIENTGTRIRVETHNETIFPQAEVVINAISGFIGLVALVISFGSTLLPLLMVIASMFVLPMFFLFMLTKFRQRVKDTLNKK